MVYTISCCKGILSKVRLTKIQFCIYFFKIEKREKNERPEKPFMVGIV